MFTYKVFRGKYPDLVDFEILEDISRLKITMENDAVSVTIFNVAYFREYMGVDRPSLLRGKYSMRVEKALPSTNPARFPSVTIEF